MLLSSLQSSSSCFTFVSNAIGWSRPFRKQIGPPTRQHLGLALYQIRGWKALCHHLALSTLALHYIVEQQVVKGEEIPLLSSADVKMAITHQLFQQMSQGQIMELILKKTRDDRRTLTATSRTYKVKPGYV